MTSDAAGTGWRALFAPAWIPAIAVMLGGILLHSMNVLMMATVLPSIVGEIGGAALMSWPTTFYLASSIVAATCTGLLASRLGTGRTFALGAGIFAAGTLICGLAPAMAQVIAGRFVQGLGGGLLSALAYVLVRQVFPASLWARAFALLSSIWGISVLIGPLVGGVFADSGHWRGAFIAVAALALGLAVLALWTLPRTARSTDAAAPGVPFGRVALICLAIAAMSSAAVATTTPTKAAMIAVAAAAFAVALRLDRRARTRLLPSDAFSPRSATGIGLWMVLLLSIAYTPMSIFGPLFLQHIHGLSPLAAGYTVATSSMGWTVVSVLIASAGAVWSSRLIVLGPLATMTGLLGVGTLMPAGPFVALVPAISLIGTGAGCCWAFIAQRTMAGAKPGDEDAAAGAIATVQQVGMAFGAAIAGLVANVIGFSGGLQHQAILDAARWVPTSFALAALTVCLLGLGLNRIARRPAIAV
jgi:MFS family permease